MRFWSFGFLFLATALALTADDLAFIGKWKMDPARSDLTGTLITFESLPGGEWKSSSQGMTYKFKMDGMDHATGMGDTAAWEVVDSSTWQTTWKSNGKLLSTETLRIAGDGKTLNVTARGTKPNGEPINDSTAFQRVSGGPGLAGQWKSTTVKADSPSVIELVSFGKDGLTFRQPAWGVSCEARLDARDYPCTTPLGPGWTIGMTRSGERTLEMTVKKDGKPFVRMTNTVSEDGKTLTQISEAIVTNERTKIIYDRQ